MSKPSAYYTTLISYSFLVKDVWHIVDDYLNFRFFHQAVFNDVCTHVSGEETQTAVLHMLLENHESREIDLEETVAHMGVTLSRVGMFPFTIRFHHTEGQEGLMTDMTTFFQTIKDLQVTRTNSHQFVLFTPGPETKRSSITLIVTDTPCCYGFETFPYDYIVWENEFGQGCVHRPKTEPDIASMTTRKRRRRQTEVESLGLSSVSPPHTRLRSHT